MLTRFNSLLRSHLQDSFQSQQFERIFRQKKRIYFFYVLHQRYLFCDKINVNASIYQSFTAYNTVFYLKKVKFEYIMFNTNDHYKMITIFVEIISIPNKNSSLFHPPLHCLHDTNYFCGFILPFLTGTSNNTLNDIKHYVFISFLGLLCNRNTRFILYFIFCKR